jgi:hypothetical protein
VGVELAAPQASAAARGLGLLRISVVPARVLLAGIVGLSAALRFALALAHVTPLYLPDEYIYSSLARGIAETGRPVIRGGAAHFPALLEPLLASPFWLFDDPATAYRLTQGLNAFAMSLAAIPLYLLCRRLGLGKWTCLGGAALTVVSPDMFFTSFLLAEPIAYPLVLTAIYLAVCVLDSPTRWTQVALVTACGFAAFARIQYVVLPLAFAAAALVVERGSVRRALSRFRLSLALFALPVVAALVAGPARVLGYYSGIADLHVAPLRFIHWVGTDLMLLAYASGWILVPAALTGLTLAFVRPRARVEQAFAAVLVATGALILAETAEWATNAGNLGHFQERYLMCLIPFVWPAFALFVRRDRRGRAPVALVAAGMLVLSARVPLSGYTDTQGRQDSPFLFGVSKLEKLVGAANGSLAVAAVVAVLSLAAIGVTFRPRRAGIVGFVLAAAFLATADAGAWQIDREISRHARATYVPADARWIDHAHLGSVVVVHTPGAPRPLVLEQMFWNRSADTLVRLRRAEVVDAFGEPRVRIAGDGSLFVGGKPLVRPLLLAKYAVAAEFRGAKRVRSTNVFDLWRPVGTPRLSLLAGGRYYDGWLATSGYVRVWPDTSGRVEGVLRIPLELPRLVKTTRLQLSGADLRRTVTLHPGARRVVTVHVSSAQVWTLRFRTTGGAYLTDGRAISARVGAITFTREDTSPSA